MSDLTAEEQTSVRVALRFLRSRCGGWAAVGKALRFKESTIIRLANTHPPTASLAIRLARLVGISVDDVLTGKYPPPGTCPYCGHRPEPAEAAAR